MAEVREARPGHAVRRRRRGAGAARGRDVAAAGRDRRGARGRSTPATRSRSARRTTRAIGKGICNYSAAELRRVMGRKSAQVREVLPRATEEAVHRDYFVLRLDFLAMAVAAAQRHRDLPRRAGRRRARWRRMSTAARRTPRCCAIADALEARAPTRSSRPTRATSRPGARPASRARCWTGWRSTRRGSPRSPARCATIAALPDPVGEVHRRPPAAQRARRRARCACRSASSPSSTRRGRT